MVINRNLGQLSSDTDIIVFESRGHLFLIFEYETQDSISV